MAGMGSASTLIPVYYSLGVPFSMAAAAGLLLNVFTLSTATINNARHNLIRWKLGTIIVIPAIIAAPIGAIIGIGTPKNILLSIFVVFLSYTMYNLIRNRKKKQDNLVTGIRGTALGVVIGGFAGFMGGLLGVGGGLIVLPIMTFMERDYKAISGTCAYIVLFISASGFLSYLTLLRGVDYALWIIVLVGGILGGIIGSTVINRYRSQTIRYVILLIIAAVAVKLAYTIAAPFM